MKSPLFWIIVLMMAATLLTIKRRGDADRVLPSVPLAQMPHALGHWSGTDVPLDQETLDVLGKGVFLNRQYISAEHTVAAAPVSLFIGYFPTQRTGQSIHSPQHCLPGAGWVFDSNGLTTLPVPGGKAIQVGEYVISDGSVKAEVLYWYQSQGQAIAGDLAAKLATIANSIRYHRTDAALIRVITPILKEEDQEAAHRRAVTFSNEFVPTLSRYIPD